MNDRDRRESGRLMLISPERVFYAGLLGRPRKRCSGGYHIYAAMHGHLKITEGKSEMIGRGGGRSALCAPQRRKRASLASFAW